jgi:hypothetical protein
MESDKTRPAAMMATKVERPIDLFRGISKHPPLEGRGPKKLAVAEAIPCGLPKKLDGVPITDARLGERGPIGFVDMRFVPAMVLIGPVDLGSRKEVIVSPGETHLHWSYNPVFLVGFLEYGFGHRADGFESNLLPHAMTDQHRYGRRGPLNASYSNAVRERPVVDQRGTNCIQIAMRFVVLHCLFPRKPELNCISECGVECNKALILEKSQRLTTKPGAALAGPPPG